MRPDWILKPELGRFSSPRQESLSGVSLDQVGLRMCLCGSECGQHRLQAMSWTVSEEKRLNENKQPGCLLSLLTVEAMQRHARSLATAFDVPETMTLT